VEPSRSAASELRAREALAAIFGDSSRAPLRLTPAGLYHATPLPVLVAAVEALLRAPPLSHTGSLTVLDAGAGDGRMLCALGLIAPSTRRLRLVGIECDAELHRESCERLAALARRPVWPRDRGAALLHGDWSSPAAFESLGLELADFQLVLNYPDGSEARLAALLARTGHPGGRLALIQPHPPRALSGCRIEWSRSIAPGALEPRWHVALLTWQS
jgi:hypothetical protein